MYLECHINHCVRDTLIVDKFLCIKSAFLTPQMDNTSVQYNIQIPMCDHLQGGIVFACRWYPRGMYNVISLTYVHQYPLSNRLYILPEFLCCRTVQHLFCHVGTQFCHTNVWCVDWIIVWQTVNWKFSVDKNADHVQSWCSATDRDWQVKTLKGMVCFLRWVKILFWENNAKATGKNTHADF